MKKERIKILDMLEAGKISVDDAARLLESLRTGSGEFEWSQDYEDAEAKLHQFSKNVDSFAREFSEKFSVVFKEVEPKLKSATKKVLDKTVTLLDDVSRSLHEAANNMEPKCDCEEPKCCEDEPNQN